MSQLDTSKTTINGKQYTMTPLPPELSMDLLTDLVAIISPIVAPILGSVFTGKGAKETEDVLDREINPDMFSQAFSKLNPVEMKSVRKQLVQAFSMVTEVDNVRLENVVETVFYGDVSALLQWLAWGCKVQWGKCLSGLIKSRLSQGAIAEALSKSQNT